MKEEEDDKGLSPAGDRRRRPESHSDARAPAVQRLRIEPKAGAIQLSQNSALIMRDVLETVFLIDLFRPDRSAIARWRLANVRVRFKKSNSAR